MDQMEKHVNEETIFECFAAAEKCETHSQTAESFVDVEEYENNTMYPAFARWAKAVGYDEIANLFLKVAGEEKLHAKWLRELYKEMGTPTEGKDTLRAKEALTLIQSNMGNLLQSNPKGLIEKALKVSYRVEMRECTQIYPAFRAQALESGNIKAAGIYQKVIDSETQHAQWFEAALKDLLGQSNTMI